MRLRDRIRDLARAGGGDPDAPLDPLAGGDICTVVRVGDVVVKALPDGPAGLFAAEEAGLARLGGAGAPVPEVLHRADDGLVLRYLAPGEADWEAMGRVMAALHRPAGDRYGTDSPVFLGRFELPLATGVDWTPWFREHRLRPLLDAARDALGPELHDRASRWLDRAAWEAEGPCVVHGDCWAGNVMHTRRGPMLIDPSAQWAERGLDVAMMRLFGGFPASFWRAYEAARPLPDTTREALPAYSLYYVLAHVVFFGTPWIGAVRGWLSRAGG
jgi:phosphatidylserine decarboxylase